MARHYYSIDVLRFGAALSVLIFHLGFYSWASDYSTTAHAFGHVARFEFLTPWTWFGWVGVEVFFVISGFVIANSANASTPMAFFRGRVVRLYPAALVGALVSLAALVFIVGDPIRSLTVPFLKSFLLYPYGPWIDGVYWSLAVEIAFYFLIFILLVAGKFGSIRLLAWGLTVWSGAYVVAAFWFERSPVDPHWWLTANAFSDILLLRFGSFFAVGIWLWLGDRRMLGHWEAAGLLVAIAVSCGEIILHVRGDIPSGASAWANISPIIPIGIWLAAIAVIGLSGRHPDFFTPRSEGARLAVRRMGAMTYPLYLMHNVAGVAVSRFLIVRGVNPVAALACAAFAMIVLSYVVCRFWEPVARGFLKERIRKLEDVARGRSSQLDFLFASGGACIVKDGE